MAWYQIIIQPDEGAWMVTAPDFPEVTTFGATQQEACEQGVAAIEEAIAGRIADGDAIPVPMVETPPKGHFVQIPLMVYLKAALYMTLREQGKTRADLMRELGWQRESVDRLFRLDHQTKLASIEKAFDVLGVPLAVNVRFPTAEAA